MVRKVSVSQKSYLKMGQNARGEAPLFKDFSVPLPVLPRYLFQG